MAEPKGATSSALDEVNFGRVHGSPGEGGTGGEGMSTQCQLKVMPEAGERLSHADTLIIRSQTKLAWLHRMGVMTLADPARAVRKLASLGGSATLQQEQEERRTQDTGEPVVPPALGLQPGERVRVRTSEEIEATLDAEGRCQGLAFMGRMADHCGREYVVRKRVRRFFDERTRRLLKLRNVVILEGVYCEPPRGDFHDYAGCDRTCFFFWKEAWLERVRG